MNRGTLRIFGYTLAKIPSGHDEDGHEDSDEWAAKDIQTHFSHRLLADGQKNARSGGLGNHIEKILKADLKDDTAHEMLAKTA
jgi:hypothetical protein